MCLLLINMKTFLLIFLLVVFMIDSSFASAPFIDPVTQADGVSHVLGSSSDDGIANPMKSATSSHQVIRKMMERKVVSSGLDVLDYRDPGANPVHEPGKGKSGGRATTP